MPGGGGGGGGMRTPQFGFLVESVLGDQTASYWRYEMTAWHPTLWPKHLGLRSSGHQTAGIILDSFIRFQRICGASPFDCWPTCEPPPMDWRSTCILPPFISRPTCGVLPSICRRTFGLLYSTLADLKISFIWPKAHLKTSSIRL